MKLLNRLTKGQWLLVSFLILLLLFFGLNPELFGLLIDGDVEKIRHFFRKNIGFALVFMALVMLIQNSFITLPLIFVITVNVALFGFMNGFLWSWLTSIMASIVVYYCVRYVFQKAITERYQAKIIDKMDTNGFVYVFQARIFPFVPTSLVNILAGLSTIRILPFILATSLGNFLYFFVLALIPAGILSSTWNEYVIWAVIIALIVLYYFVKVTRNKKLQRNQHE